MWRFLNSNNRDTKLYRDDEYIPISFLARDNRNNYCISAKFKVNWRSDFDESIRAEKEDFMGLGIRTLVNKVLENRSGYSLQGWCSGNTRFVFRESVILDFYTKYCPVVVLAVKKEDFLELRDLSQLTFDVLSSKLVAISSEDLSGFHYTKLRKYFKEELDLNPNKHVIKVPTQSFIGMFFKLDYSVAGLRFYDREYQESLLNRAIENLKSKYSPATENVITEQNLDPVEEPTALTVVRQEVLADMSQYYYLSNGTALEVNNLELFEVFDRDEAFATQVYNQMMGIEEQYDGDLLMDADYWNEEDVFMLSHEEADEALESVRRDVERREVEEDDDIEVFDDIETTSNWAQDIDNLSVAGSENINNGTLYTMSNSNRIWFPSSVREQYPESPTDAEVIEAYQELVAPDVYGIWGWGELGVRLIPLYEYTNWITTPPSLPDGVVFRTNSPTSERIYPSSGITGVAGDVVMTDFNEFSVDMLHGMVQQIIRNRVDNNGD